MTTFSILLHISLAFVYFLVPGILLWLVFRDSCRRWHSSTLAWVIVLGFRWYYGNWNIRFGGNTDELPFSVESLAALVSWALASILIWASYRVISWIARQLTREPQG